MNGPIKQAGQADNLAGAQNKKLAQTVASDAQAGKPFLDITEHASGNAAQRGDPLRQPAAALRC